MSIVQSKPFTAADLLAMPDGKDFELVDGELVERNVSVLSSNVEFRVLRKLAQYDPNDERVICLTSSNGIRCFPNPNTVRKPDISVVKRERLSPQHWQEGFLTIAPDVVIEVISPNDLASETEEKVEQYIAAGIALIWVINPETRTIVVNRRDSSINRLRENDELSGENVLVGFHCKVAELFPETQK
jgi:Uma2 family endonuclease